MLEKKKEEIIRASGSYIADMSEQKIQDLFYELQKHQIELKTQNEELIRVQRELQDSRDRYFDLYNFAPAAYLTIDREGKIIDGNLTATSYLAVEMEELKGKKMIDFIAPDDKEGYRNHVHALFAEKGKKPWALKMVKSDGSIIYTRLESAFIRDLNGNEVQRAEFLDITCQRNIAQNLENTIEALRQSNTELERFAYVASHDLREPLRNIATCTQLLHMKYNDKLDAEAQQLIAYTNDSVQQMNSLISDLLFYSSQGSNSIRFSPVDLEKTLEHVFVNLHQVVTSSKAKITYDKMPKVMADSVQMVQLLQNLLSNAIKYNDKKNILIHLGVKREGGNWIFSIKDNGIGIEKQYFEQIFEIFKRLESKADYPGTGIGLSICRRVIENHSGKIWVESTTGIGSEFFFTLPASPKVEPQV
jgi:chemotaxis family two-component system sensor kinase Cph1